MKRVNMFLTILIASIAALIAATTIGFVLFSQAQNPTNWMSQMWGGSSNYGGMGGMMGQTGTTTSSSLLPYFGVLFAVLIVVTIIGIVGVGYYLLYPQIRFGTVGVIQTIQNISATQPAANSANGATPYESITKTLTGDERKILEVLNSHQGKYLQKYIRNETGLSRLQTHRIIARLADRGIVSLEKIGNTNQIYLANWLIQKQ
jgi:predicted transcriptional regulator